MARLFSEHLIRRVESLDGMWRFCTDPTDVGEKEEWFKSLDTYQQIAVPSVWNEEKDLLGYEGAAWYEKKFYTEGGTLRFCFGAVMTYSRVWFDGIELGAHYGGFSQFDFIVDKVERGEHTLTVMADNRFDAHSIPQLQVDWYHYGGIIRGVTVETLSGICVLGNRFEYTLSNDMKSANGRFILELYNASDDKTESSLSISVGQHTVFDGRIEVEPGERKTVSFPEFQMDDIKLWDVGAPNLYDVKFVLDNDDLFDRVGFRKIEVKDRKIFLNGEELEIRGINRHEEYPGFGFSFPLSRMKHDVDLILDLGCNAIRGSHYPNSQAFVDYLDEVGILFWSEIPIWGNGFSAEALADRTVLERGLEMHREMLKYYYNHPAVIFWGMHNEILSNTVEGLEMTKKYYSYLKENGGNRLVVYASSRDFQDISFKYTDIICLNKYIGWYEGKTLSDWDVFLENFRAYAEKEGVSHLPIIMSEFGSAAIYGFHDTECPKWSEEYQAKLFDYCLTLFHEHPAISGSFVWQFADIRTCAEMGFSRARGFNNKGLLNEYRRPKMAYHTVKKCYLKFSEEFAENKKTL